MTAARGMSKPRYHYGGERVASIEAGLERERSANAKRVPCPHCNLTIAPEGLTRHIALVHDEE